MKKLSILQDKVESITKGDSLNAGYKNIQYANIADVMKIVNDSMKDLGLHSKVNFEPINGTQPITPIQQPSKNGNIRNMFIVTGTYSITITDTETNEIETFSTIASALMNDPSAACGSVMTYFDRYLWSKILRVAFTTEKEVEQTMFQQPQQPQTPQQPIETQEESNYKNNFIAALTKEQSDFIKKHYQIQGVSMLSIDVMKQIAVQLKLEI